MKFIEEIKGSLTDWSHYEKVAFQRTRKTLKYFFVLFLILFAMTGIKSAIGLSADLEQFAAAFRTEVPDFRFEKGEFWFSGEQPYFLEGKNNSLLAIDTTGKTDDSVLNDYIDGLYITKTKVFIKQQGEVTEINLKDFRQRELSKDSIVAFLPKLKWFIPLLLLLGFVVQVAAKMISAVFLAIVGMFFNNSYKGKLAFRQLWNVAVYALSLPLLLETMVKLVYPQLPWFTLIYFAIGIVYVARAVRYILDNRIVSTDPEAS